MCGKKRFYQIDHRLREAFPLQADVPFGGRSILLAGDLRQLPPVGDLALYSTNPGNVQQQQGGTLYRLFDKYIRSLQVLFSSKNIQSICSYCAGTHLS